MYVCDSVCGTYMCVGVCTHVCVYINVYIYICVCAPGCVNVGVCVVIYTNASETYIERTRAKMNPTQPVPGKIILKKND